jgi:hypothetical protein
VKDTPNQAIVHRRVSPSSSDPRLARSSIDEVFVTIGGDGTIEASTGGHTTAWQRSFARHHRIRLDKVGGLTVSTVFLGVAHRLRSGDLVAAFETIVFGPDGLTQESWLWGALEEARVGHAWVLAEALARRTQCDRLADRAEHCATESAK